MSECMLCTQVVAAAGSVRSLTGRVLSMVAASHLLLLTFKFVHIKSN